MKEKICDFCDIRIAKIKSESGIFHRIKNCGQCDNFIILLDDNRNVINPSWCKLLEQTVDSLHYEGYKCKSDK